MAKYFIHDLDFNMVASCNTLKEVGAFVGKSNIISGQVIRLGKFYERGCLYLFIPRVITGTNYYVFDTEYTMELKQKVAEFNARREQKELERKIREDFKLKERQKKDTEAIECIRENYLNRWLLKEEQYELIKRIRTLAGRTSIDGSDRKDGLKVWLEYLGFKPLYEKGIGATWASLYILEEGSNSTI